MIMFLFSCGLPDVIYLDPPIFIHSPTSHIDGEEGYFSFKTSDVENTTNAGAYFKGFDIFYCIYESETDCENEIKSAEAKNEADPFGAASYLRTNLNFKFLARAGKSTDERPLIVSTGVDREVRFRLKDHSPTDKAELKIDSVSVGEVLRSNGENFLNISITDNDVKKASLGGVLNPTKFYIACFAVTYGNDDNYSKIYSEIVKLGYVEISNP